MARSRLNRADGYRLELSPIRPQNATAFASGPGACPRNGSGDLEKAPGNGRPACGEKAATADKWKGKMRTCRLPDLQAPRREGPKGLKLSKGEKRQRRRKEAAGDTLFRRTHNQSMVSAELESGPDHAGGGRCNLALAARLSSGHGRQSGFSLLELLIVVAVIGIIAAIAVPRLQSSRKAAFEASAISYMRTWVAAQELYMMRRGVYADADNQLVQAGLVGNPDPDRFGYIFSLDNPPNSRTIWWGRANPKQRGVTGDRHFFIDNTGVIRWSLGGPANITSTPLGAQP